jgi:hypothetical protein
MRRSKQPTQGMKHGMNETRIYTTSEFKLYSEVLDFLEDVYSRRGQYIQGSPSQESTVDVLTLSFVKVVNDCRAILLLAQSGFYIQAGVLARSTEDACSLIMHIGFEGENAALVKKWLSGRRVTHWMLVKKLNENLPPEHQLDVANYRRVRKRLDDFVHANYDALKLYPAQSPGSTPLDDKSFYAMTFWKHLIYLYLFSCLLAVELIVPDLGDRAKSYLEQLESRSRNLSAA